MLILRSVQHNACNILFALLVSPGALCLHDLQKCGIVRIG
jgi:hypothetical protein